MCLVHIGLLSIFSIFQTISSFLNDVNGTHASPELIAKSGESVNCCRQQYMSCEYVYSHPGHYCIHAPRHTSGYRKRLTLIGQKNHAYPRVRAEMEMSLAPRMAVIAQGVVEKSSSQCRSMRPCPRAKTTRGAHRTAHGAALESQGPQGYILRIFERR